MQSQVAPANTQKLLSDFKFQSHLFTGSSVCCLCSNSCLKHDLMHVCLGMNAGCFYSRPIPASHSNLCQYYGDLTGQVSHCSSTSMV